MEEIIYKKCKVCKIDKDYNLDYTFHKTTGYFYNTCTDCQNERRKLNYKPKEKKEVISYKICKTCNISKQRNVENFDVLSNGKKGIIFTKSCKECRKNFVPLNPKVRRFSNKDENKLKTCNLCKKEKPLKEYYFHFKLNTHSYCCISCEANRKKQYKQNLSEEDLEKFKLKGRQNNAKNQINNLLTTYHRFDFDRNFKNDLTKDFIKKCLEQKCSYCFYKPTGLDRINNNLGHLQNNCVPCCLECNTARMNNFTYEEMLVIGQAIKLVKDNIKCLH